LSPKTTTTLFLGVIKRMKLFKFAGTVIGLSLLAAGPALAYEAGDWLVRGRIINVNPYDDSGNLYTGGLGNLGHGVTVDDDTVPELDVTYMITLHWGVELILGYSEHDVSTKSPAKYPVPGVNLGQVIETKVLPPTLTLQYHFAPNSNIRPYIGAGVNYTHFFDEEVTGFLDQPGAKVKLASSWGLAAQAGVDVDISENWFVNFDVKYLDIDTKARFKGVTAVSTANINDDIDPFVYGIGIGRRF
jgi:outer membrane protein